MVAAAWRSLAFAFTPERAWQRHASQRDAISAGRHLGALALIPAVVAALLVAIPTQTGVAAGVSPLAPASPYSLALGGMALPAVPVTPVAARASLHTALGAAAAAYVGTWLVVASGALILRLLMPLFSVQRSLRRCMLVASFAATPVLLSSVALLHPALSAIVGLAAMHAFYVAYVGLPIVLGVSRTDAGMCLGLAVIAALLFGQLAGYALGALLSATQ